MMHIRSLKRLLNIVAFSMGFLACNALSAISSGSQHFFIRSEDSASPLAPAVWSRRRSLCLMKWYLMCHFGLG